MGSPFRMEPVFFAGGINGEKGVLDACEEFAVYASGKNLVKIGKTDERIMKALPFEQSHDGHIHSVSIVDVEDHKYIVSASADKAVQIWLDSTLIHTIRHDQALLYATGYQGISKVIAFDDQGSVLIWEAEGDAYKLKQKISYGPKRVHSVAWSNEGVLAVGTSDKLIRILVENEGQMTQVLALSGHTNWAVCLEWSPTVAEGYRILASCSPDKTVRLWKLFQEGESSASESGLRELIPSKKSFKLENGEEYTLDKEAILYGHEGMVNSCHWAKSNRDGDFVRDLRLVSASADNTIIIWALLSSTWASSSHIGDISGSSSVGGDRSFGFFSAVLLDEHLLANGSNGNVQSWKRIDRESYIELEPETPITGHFSSVQSCTWDRLGRFLLSTSLDQTTRAFAQCKKSGQWHEVGRPQIHGYDLRCIASITPDTFVSGADEKVLRVFSMPEAFQTRLESLTEGSASSEAAAVRPTFVPALGLSNKASGEVEGFPVVAERALGDLPTESDLCRHTLWPEIDKLYGHGYELYSVAVNGEGTLMASSARANLTADAGVQFWVKPSGETGARWIPSGHVTAHSLTVVSLAFSPSGHFLLATSRDRTWSVISASEPFKTIQREEGHSRIIWSGTWISDSAFVTVSRDKYLKVWSLQDGLFKCTKTLTFGSGLTAVDANGSFLAVGEESGLISNLKIDQDFTLHAQFQAASAAINDIKWHPNQDLIAVVSEDRSVRLFQLK